MNPRRLAITVATAVALSSPAWATIFTSQQFVTEAGQAGMSEVALSKMALERSSDPSIKTFAKDMIEDHGKAGEELRTIASNDNLKVPTTVSARQKAAAKKMEKLTGEAFNEAYAKQMVTDHDKAVHLFKEASTADGLQANLKEFAAKTLPTLEHHQTNAHGVMGQVVGSREMHGHGEAQGQ